MTKSPAIHIVRSLPVQDNIERDNFLQEALRAPTGLHTYQFIPSKDLLQQGRVSQLEYSQYDSLTREAHFVLELYHEAIRSVHVRLYKNPQDQHPALSAEMIGDSIGRSKPFANYSCVFKNVPPETTYHFTVEYEDGRVENIADPYSLGMVSGRWEKGKFIDPRSQLIDFQYVAGFPSEMFLKNPIDQNKLRVYEMHVHYTKTIPDRLLSEEFKGMQGYIAALASQPVVERLKALGRNVLQCMPIQNGINESHLPPGVNNLWNYYNSSLVAPREDYCFAKTAHGRIREIQVANSLLMAQGIWPIIDVVLGHTSEGIAWGHPHSLARMGKYYHMDENGNPRDSSGCGNTVNYDTPEGRALLAHVTHVWLDLYNFAGFRDDQGTIIGRRDGSCMFDGDSPALKYKGTETRLRGKIATVEPCDCHNGQYTSHHGEFDENFVEQNVSSRDVVQNFTGGHCFQDFPPGDGPSHDANNTNEGITKTGRRDPIVRSLLSLVAREYYFEGHRGKYNPKKPLDMMFTACHDGLTDWDRTAYSLNDLKESGIARFAMEHVEGKTIAEKELYLRLHLWFANHALVHLRPGPNMDRYNSETLATQFGDHNAYTNPQYIQMDQVTDTDELKKFKDIALRLKVNLASLVSRMPVFDRYADNHKLKLQLFNIEGKACEVSGLEVDVDNLSQYSQRSRYALGRFAGMCYTQTEKGLAETIAEGFSDDRCPVYIAAAGCNTDYYLPEVPAGYCWTRVMDTQLKADSAFMSEFCRPYKGNRENPRQAHYVTHKPGVAVFELRKDFRGLMH